MECKFLLYIHYLKDGEYCQLDDGTIERNGYGEHITNSGMILKGEWKHDKMNGKGLLIIFHFYKQFTSFIKVLKLRKCKITQSDTLDL